MGGSSGIPSCLSSLGSSLWGAGGETPLSSGLLLPEALWLVLVHPSWKECLLVELAVPELSHLNLPQCAWATHFVEMALLCCTHFREGQTVGSMRCQRSKASWAEEQG